LNKVKEGLIPENRIIQQPRNQFEALQNNTYVLNAARALGLNIVNLGPEDLLEGKVSLKRISIQLTHLVSLSC
jgi:hypothetical protein